MSFIRKRERHEAFSSYDEYLNELEQQVKRARTELQEYKNSELVSHILSLPFDTFSGIVPFLSTSSLLSIRNINQSHQQSIDTVLDLSYLHGNSTDLACIQGKLF